MDVHTQCRCPHCGSDEVDVVRRFCETTYYETWLPCEHNDNSEAARRTYWGENLMEEIGHYDEDGRIEWDVLEEVEHLGFEDDEYETHCSCVEDAKEDDWITEILDHEEHDEETILHCNGCGHEEAIGGAV